MNSNFTMVMSRKGDAHLRALMTPNLKIFLAAFVLLVLAFQSSTAFAQCVNDRTPPMISCKPGTITLNQFGFAAVSVNDVVDQLSDNCGVRSVTFSTSVFDCSHVGIPQSITVTATDTSGNAATCMATLMIADGNLLTLTCPPDTTLTNLCLAAGTNPDTTVTGSIAFNRVCTTSPVSVSYSDVNVPNTDNCRVITRTFTVTDGATSATCQQVITLTDTIAPTWDAASLPLPTDTIIACTSSLPAAVTLDYDDNCTGSGTANAVYASGQGFDGGDCDFYTYDDTYTWTVSDGCANSISHVQTISFLDTVSPVVTGFPAGLRLAAASAGPAPGCLGTVGYTFTLADITDNCASDAHLDFDIFIEDDNGTVVAVNGVRGLMPPSASSLSISSTQPIGEYVIVFTATDPCGNETEVRLNQAVVDNVPPTASCVAPGTMVSVSTNNAINAALVNAGSFDPNCGSIDSMFLTYAPYDCFDLPISNFPVTLTVIDDSGNRSSCSTTIDLMDGGAPVAECQNVTKYLDAAGDAAVLVADINNGSSDPCTGLNPDSTQISYSGMIGTWTSSLSYDCDSLGTNTAYLRVVDSTGNAMTCSAVISIRDSIRPTASCTNISINLDADGTYELTTTDRAFMSSGSVDICGFETSVSQTSFNCSDIVFDSLGNLVPVPVTLTVEDPSGNTASCMSQLTINDVTGPAISCLDTFRPVLTGTGMYNLIAQELFAPNVFLTGSDLDSGNVVSTSYGFTASNATQLSFNWNYTTTDITAAADRFGYVVNGGPFVLLSDTLGGLSQSNSATINIGVGQSFEFVIRSMDDDDGAASVVISSINQNMAGDLAAANWTLNTGSGNGTAYLMDVCGVDTYQLRTGSGSFSDTLEIDCGTTSPLAVEVLITDVNGTATVCTTSVVITDNQPPVAGCDEVVQSLDGNGMAEFRARQFNQGSRDACAATADLSYRVAIDDGTANPTFRNRFTLDCDSVGRAVSVILEVSDPSGNKAFCYTTATVQDNFGPTITTPADRIVTCGMSTDTIAMGVATATTNCGPAPVIWHRDANTDDLNGFNTASCRVIRRQWFARDVNGNVSTGFQEITIEDNTNPTMEITYDGNIIPNGGIIDAECGTGATLSTANVTANDNCATATITLDTIIDPRIDVNGDTLAGLTFMNAAYYNYNALYQFTVTDSCGNAVSSNALIQVRDTQAPVFATTSPITHTNDPGDCGKMVSLDIANSVSDCTPSSTLVFSHQINGGATVNGSDASGFYPVGTHNVTFTVTDLSGNTASNTVVVAVTDDEPPTVACVTSFTASLTNGIYPLTINDIHFRSNDNCQVQSLTLSRSSLTCSDIDPALGYGTVVVTLTATDAHGNPNTCSTAIRVEANAPPVIQCPADLMVQCYESTHPDSLNSRPTVSSTCPSTVNITWDDVIMNNTGANCFTIQRTWTARLGSGTDACVQMITVRDNLAPRFTTTTPADTSVQACALPGIPTMSATDSCAGVIIPNFMESGQGTNPAMSDYYNYSLTRSWTAADNCGNSTVTSQVITVRDTILPTTTIMDSINVEVTSSTSCEAMVNIDLRDFIADCAEDAYLTITNTAPLGDGFALISGNYSPGIYPVMVSATDPSGNTLLFDFDLIVRDAVTPEAECKTNLTTLVLDNNGNGMINAASIDNGSSDNCPNPVLSLSQMDFTSADVGLNQVMLTVTDAAGNTNFCSSTVDVVEQFAVSVAHVTGSAPDTIRLAVTGEHFNNLSGLSFSLNVADPSIATIGRIDASNSVLTGISAGDYAITGSGSGMNFSYATGGLNGVDPNPADGSILFEILIVPATGPTGASTAVDLTGLTVGRTVAGTPSSIPGNATNGSVTLGSSTMITLSGNFFYRNTTDPISMVGLSHDNGFINPSASSTFSLDVAMGSTVTLNPSKNINPMNGVDVLDLTILKDHLLNGTPFSSPFTYIAADLNSNDMIDLLDRIELELLVSNPITFSSFQSNDSWLFVDANAPLTGNPLGTGYANTITVTNATASQSNLNFAAVKIGDLTNANSSLAGGSLQGPGTLDDRSAPATLSVDDRVLVAGNTYEVEFFATNFDDIRAYQTTLALDPSVAVIEGAVPGQVLPDMTESMFGMDEAQNGLATALWYHTEGVAADPSLPVFTLKITAIADAQLSSVLAFSDALLNPFAAHSDLSTAGFELVFNSPVSTQTVGSSKFELYQNRPNPFNGQTMISFNLPEGGKAALRVTDVTGRVVWTNEANYQAGYNEVLLNRNNLPATGLYYFYLQTEDRSAVRRMILSE